MAFPINPSINSTHQIDDRVWFFNGTAWQRIDVVNTKLITGATYNAEVTDYYIGVSYSGTAGIVLPSLPVNGQMLIVKDESGRAGDPYKYIVIRGASMGDKIDNKDSAIININNGALDFIYRNGWRIV